MVKNLCASVGGMGLIPGSGSSPRGGNSNPFQYSCLRNSTDRGAWQATVRGVAKSWTRLGTHTHRHTHTTTDKPGEEARGGQSLKGLGQKYNCRGGVSRKRLWPLMAK